MFTIKQLSLFIENRPGALSAVCQVLKSKNISIRTLSLADTQNFGILRLLVKEVDAARTALEAAGFVVKVTDVLALQVPDYAGGLADMLSYADKYALQIEYMYAFTFGRNGKAVIVVSIEDPEAAAEKLKDEPIELVDGATLFN